MAMTLIRLRARATRRHAPVMQIPNHGVKRAVQNFSQF
jgi:hypothetical protein